MNFCECNKEENKGVITVKILIICNMSLTIMYIQKCRHILFFFFLSKISILEVFFFSGS